MELIQVKTAKEVEKKILIKIIDALKDGKVVVCPTDTIYGILADATQKDAVQKIFKIKGRLKAKPLPLFVANLKAAKRIARINKMQEQEIKRFWPGKITLVFKRRPGYKIFGVDRKSIAIRIPDYYLLNAVLRKASFPLVQTSVNISGQKPLKSGRAIFKKFKGSKYRPDLIIDIGLLSKGKPSVILDLRVLPPRILRA